MTEIEKMKDHLRFVLDRWPAVRAGGVTGIVTFIALAPVEFIFGAGTVLTEGLEAIFSGSTFVYLTAALMLTWGLSPTLQFVRDSMMQIYESIIFGVSFLTSIGIAALVAHKLFENWQFDIATGLLDMLVSVGVIYIFMFAIGPYTGRLIANEIDSKIMKAVFFVLTWIGAIIIVIWKNTETG